MDVVLISSRGHETQPHWSAAAAALVAHQLLAAGLRVGWLCPLTRAEPEPRVPGVTVTTVRAAVPPFRRVSARISDTALDVLLARTLRPLRQPLVVHVGFGAPGSVTTLWLAERMGALPFAAVRAAEVLCHRRTLVDATGAVCRDTNDAERCAACASAVWQQGGLGPLAARAARSLRWLGGWSPFPSANAFRSRADLTLASLQVATVAVATAAESALLQQAGIPERALRVVGPITANGLPTSASPDAAGFAAAVAAFCAEVGR